MAPFKFLEKPDNILRNQACVYKILITGGCGFVAHHYL